MYSKYMANIGGGLGDVFVRLYHHSQYQILPMIADKFIFDCISTCCNPAIKSVLESWITENGNPVFRDIIYRDMFFFDTIEGKKLLLDKEQDGFGFINREECWSKLFSIIDVENPFQYGFYHGKVYRHQFKVTYQEQSFFESIPKPYIVIHPSGGLQSVDGLTRDEYEWLLDLLINKFKDYTFITIGSNHERNDGDGMKHYIESNFRFEHKRFIDLTSKTSGALCTKIVENANMLIGSHSSWINLFWNFDKPTVCILSNFTKWGDGENYIKTNGCKWGFGLPKTKVVIVKSLIDNVYKDILNNVEDML